MYRRHLYKLARTRLDDVLLDEGIVDRSNVDDAQAEAGLTNRSLSELLIEREMLDEWDLAKIVARHYSLPFVDVSTYSIPREAEEVLPHDFCLENQVVVFDTFGDSYSMAVSEMLSAETLDAIGKLSEKLPFVYVALGSTIREVLANRTPAPARPAPAPKVQPEPDPAPAEDEAAAAADAPEDESESTVPARRTDLQPVSMRIGTTMAARIGNRRGSSAPVAMMFGDD